MLHVLHVMYLPTCHATRTACHVPVVVVVWCEWWCGVSGGVVVHVCVVTRTACVIPVGVVGEVVACSSSM